MNDLLTDEKTDFEIENLSPENHEEKPEIKEPIIEKPIIESSKNDSYDDIDLLAELQQKTDKDEDGSTKQSSGGANIPDVEKGEPERRNTMYANHELVAKLTIASISVGMGLLLQFISDEWTEEAEKKYTLSESRKKDILEPLTLVLEQSKAKYNPVVILVMTVIFAYIPLFIKAFRIKDEKKKLKIAKLKKIKSIPLADYEEQPKNDEPENDEPEIEIKKAVTKIEKPATTIGTLTAGQLKRIKEIKTKKGARSKADKEYINMLGLEGLV